MKVETYELILNGEEIEVTGTYFKGFEGGYFDYPEPDSFEIETIHFKGVDVTALLEDWFEHFENQILDLYYR